MTIHIRPADPPKGQAQEKLRSSRLQWEGALSKAWCSNYVEIQITCKSMCHSFLRFLQINLPFSGTSSFAAAELFFCDFGARGVLSDNMVMVAWLAYFRNRPLSFLWRKSRLRGVSHSVITVLSVIFANFLIVLALLTAFTDTLLQPGRHMNRFAIENDFANPNEK